MFLPVLLVELGFLFAYAGIKGKSVMKLITGDNQTPAKLPSGQVGSGGATTNSGGG